MANGNTIAYDGWMRAAGDVYDRPILQVAAPSDAMVLTSPRRITPNQMPDSLPTWTSPTIVAVGATNASAATTG